MTALQCKNRKFYYQHYVFSHRGFSTVYCGHCRYPRIKERKPDTPACVHFEPHDPET